MDSILTDINHLIFFRSFLQDPIFNHYIKFVDSLENSKEKSDVQNYYFTLRSELVKYSLKRDLIGPSLWKNYILHYILEDPIANDLNGVDVKLYEKWLKEDFKTLLRIFNSEPVYGEIKNTELPYEDNILVKAFLSNNIDSSIKAYLDHLKDKNLSSLEKNKVFKLGKEDLFIALQPSYKPITDLIGYESQKEKLINNTKALIKNNGGLNTLLYGDMGTGKSTMVKALTDYFKDEPLRFIEIKKSEIGRIPEVYKAVSQAGFPTILFIDDLSFDEGDDSFKELKNLLEGSFDEQPKNLLVYATSNRRNLISQSKSEREDAINARELLEEKLSLVSRFGLTINFRTPNQAQYLEIVEELLNKEGIRLDKNLKEEAIQWELRHTNRSGRTAEQFVKHVLG